MYTLDLRGIVCGVCGTDGLWVVGGDNESGITHGTGYALQLRSIAAIPEAAAAICEASPGLERDGFALTSLP